MNSDLSTFQKYYLIVILLYCFDSNGDSTLGFKPCDYLKVVASFMSLLFVNVYFTA